MRKKDAANRPLWKLVMTGVAITFLVFAFRYCTAPNVLAKQTSHVDAPTDPRDIGATEQNTYVGNSSCEKCHSALTSSQSGTSMAKSAFGPADSALAIDYSRMIYREGDYATTILPQKGGLLFSVSNGQKSVSAPIRWIFGHGVMGQTFVLQYEGKYYEGRASYYSKLGDLDLTIGHSKRIPSSLLTAMGRPLEQVEVDKCFSCHTSEDVFDGKLNVEKAHPGITCENCHGPGSIHVTTMEASHGQPVKDRTLFDPGTLAPADMNDFCGSCHRTSKDVLDTRIRDIRNIRFQPYRLENSRCYDPSDARITCVACHNPHRELETDAACYDAKCFACHAGSSKRVPHATARACPKATRNCVSCHMPKLELPGSHYAFTDHYIRVSHPDQPYPD